MYNGILVVPPSGVFVDEFVTSDNDSKARCRHAARKLDRFIQKPIVLDLGGKV